MRTTYSNRSSRSSIDSVMTPMIDVVFLLLVFFLATASFQRQEKSLTSAVAAAPDAVRQGNQPDDKPPPGLTDLSDVIVEIRRSNNKPSGESVEYKMNGEPIESLKTLTRRIGGILKIRSDVPIVIHPDNNVPAGEAIRVYDMARANGSVAVFLVGK